MQAKSCGTIAHAAAAPSRATDVSLVSPQNLYSNLPEGVASVILAAFEQLEVRAPRDPRAMTRPVSSQDSPSVAVPDESDLGLPPAATARDAVTTDARSLSVTKQRAAQLLSAALAQLDVGDRPIARRDEAQTRLAEERFERFIETMTTSVWILRDGRILYANPAAAGMLGLDRKLLVGVKFEELFSPEDTKHFGTALARAMEGAVVLPEEYPMRTREGKPLIVEVSCVGLEYDGGAAVVSFGRDVTQRKHAERELLQADRLSALGLLAGGMAHALNNPLTYVVLNLEHVARHLPGLAADTSNQAELLARLVEARQGTERMATIVKRMRSLARADESVDKVVDFRHVLESVVELVGHEVHHRGKLSTRFEAVPQVLASESRLEQICLGLLLFAAQVLPDDAEARHEVRLSLETDERNFAVLEIVCEGSMFEVSEIERLFEPFGPTEEFKLRGVGLSVCSSLVEQLGGHIVAESLPGTGLLLRTTIPCAQALRATPSSVTSGPPSALPATATGRARILLVDDDPGVGSALRVLLEAEHDVRCFEEPTEALKALLGDSGYDLILCDLMMPKLSGMDLYQVLSFNRPGYESRIVFMTGGAFAKSMTRFLEQVPNDRIEKPFNLKVLQRLVQRALRRHTGP